MTIEKSINGTNASLKIIGRLDTITAPQLEYVIINEFAAAETLVMDMEALEYVSSAGLRVILKAQKRLSAKGGMKLVNVNDTVMEVFEITGFLDILTIE